MYCIDDDQYLRDFTMMVNEDIIDCFSEEKPEHGVIHTINQVIKDNKDTLQKIKDNNHTTLEQYKKNEKINKNIYIKLKNEYIL
jgi:LysM repeat protein